MRNRSLGLLFFVSLASCSRGAERSAPVAVGAAPSAAEIVRLVRGSNASIPRAALGVDGGRYRFSAAPSPFRASGQLESSFGVRARAPLHIAPAIDRDASLDIEPLDVADAEGSVSDGALVYRDVTPGVHAMIAADAAHVEELRLLTHAVDRFVARYRLTLGAKLATARVAGSSVELLDARGVVRLRTAPITALDAHGVERALGVELAQTENEAILTVTLDARGLAFPVVVDPSWSTGVVNPRTGAGVSTYYPGVARTTGNKFIVAGGGSTTADVTARVDEYDADADGWTVRASMKVARAYYPMAATLSGGKVLVAGGASDPSANVYLSSAEVYDPGTNTWTLVGSMAAPRSQAFAVTMTDGRVLVAAGITDGGSYLFTAEIYDPVAKTWSSVGTLPSASGSFYAYKGQSTLVALPGNKALLVGNGSSANTEVDLFDGSTNSWSGRKTLIGTNLQHGNLLPGGTKFAAIHVDKSAVYDLSSNTWSAVVPAPSIYPYAVVALTSGALMATGSGSSGGFSVRYDTTAGVWLATTGSSRNPGSNAFPLSGERAIFFDDSGDVDIFTSLTNGTACTSASDCASGNCVDGVCCETACKAQCMACNESGKAGQCVIVSGAPRGSRPGCTGSVDCPGSCGGTSAVCTPAPATTSCGTSACTGSSLTDPGKCTGVDGACAYPAAKACPGNFRCADDTTCKTTCTTDLDCAAGYFCSGGSCSSTPPDTGAPDTGAPDTATDDTSMPDGTVEDSADTSVEETLPEPPDTLPPATDSAPAVSTGAGFTLCKSAADCPSGHCVDGTCCDSACDKPCFSCTLPTSPGTCSPVPLGADPHGDCSGGGSCIGTCSGTGSCVTAFVGSQCAPSKCTGPSQGIGSAFCPGKGAKCPTLAATPFDCAPFACAPAFGACLTSCSRTEHCAPGFICDATAKICVAQPPPADGSSGGCAFGARTRAGLATWSLAALTLGWMRRRRKR